MAFESAFRRLVYFPLILSICLPKVHLWVNKLESNQKKVKIYHLLNVCQTSLRTVIFRQKEVGQRRLLFEGLKVV